MTEQDAYPPGQAIPMTPLTQAIRIATTMTGGVSLAVWMGGVASELNLLGQASNLRRRSDPLTLPDDDPRRGYLDLLNLLDVTVDVDVLSGTSAGGINAALLAYSRARQKELSSLRNLWLQMGAMETLLRNPTDTEMPSLLQGDTQMYASLCTAIPQLHDAEFKAPSDSLATTLFITTTLLTGETSRFTDNYGTLLQDVDHRGMFRFEADGTEIDDSTETPDFEPAALALAARSSASFPAAFEPSFIPFAKAVPAANGVPERPAMRSLSNLTRDHWAADGGLLDNQPIDALLETIFERPARRLVRRVLLYIVPSGGPAPNPLAVPPGDDVSKPYNLLDGLLKDVGAVWNQSIGADLRAIREHNDRIGARTDTRLRLAQLASRYSAGQPTAEQPAVAQPMAEQPADAQGPSEPQPPDPLEPLLTEAMFADYCTHEADAIGGKLVAQVMRQLTTWPLANDGDTALSIPKAWASALVPGSNTEQQCRLAIRAALTEHWQPRPANAADLARFGRPAYYGVKAVALSLLRCRFLVAEWQRTQPDPELSRFLAAQVEALHDNFQPLHSGDVTAFISNALTTDDAQAKEWMAALRDKPLTEAVAELARAYLQKTAEPAPRPAAPAPQHGEQPAADSSLTASWPRLGAVVAALLADPRVDDVPAPASTAPGSRDEQIAQAAEHLRIFADYLRPCGTDEERALRLFALYAAHRAMLPVDVQAEQPVELIQLSADTRTLLDLKRSTAKTKLTGMQLDHFGAFFKRSWRANDWMWGRLDGGGWLVHLLLDPRRISMILSSQHGSRVDEFLAKLNAIGVPDPPADGIPIGPPESPNAQKLSLATIRDELAFLDDTSTTVPASLPLTSLWVARGLQQRIAARELAALAEELLQPATANPEPASAPERSWAQEVQQSAKTDPLGKAGPLLTSCPVTGEQLQQQMGTPLMVRTASKAAAVTAAAVHAMPQIPGPMRPITSVLRTVTLGGYRVTNLVKAWPRRMILAGLALLLIGGVVASGQSTLFGLTGVLIAAIGGYLVVFGAWQTSRGVLAAVVSATLVGAAATLATPPVRRTVFGQQGGKSGWLNDRVLWLGEQWWHPLVGIGAVLVVLAVIGVLFARHGSQRPVIHRTPRAVAVGIAVLIALIVVAGLAIALAIKAS